MSSPAAASAEVLWEASPEETTATLSIAVPLNTDAAVAAGNAAEALMDGARPLFFGATMTLLQKDRMNHISETLTQFGAKLIQVLFLTITIPLPAAITVQILFLWLFSCIDKVYKNLF